MEVTLTRLCQPHVLPITFEQVHVIIGACLQGCHQLILMVDEVVFHLVSLLHAVVGQVAKQIHFTSRHLRHLQCEMRKEIVAFRVVVVVFIIAHIVTPILVFVIQVIDALFISEEHCMVVGVIILHMFYPHGRHILIQNLETAVFIASREDEGTVMVEDELVHLHQCRTQIFHVIVPSAVLSHDIFQFVHRIAHGIAPVGDREVHLLMGIVGVDVCIGSHFYLDTHTRFQYREGCLCNRFGLSVLEDVQTVVARHQQLRVLIRQGQPIVAVVHFCADGRFVVVDALFFKTCHVLAGQQVAGCPVCITVCDGIGVSLILRL